MTESLFLSAVLPNRLRRAVRACLALVLLAMCGMARADEAGHIVFVSGEVHTGARVTELGDAIQEGDEISTGKDGYIYLKTVDDGLLILRPSSVARITTYHVDVQTPANTRVKLELLSGVARSVSGKAVKQARQNFRFNTPVAAIGVRGTDFTVFTDQETSNVTVLSGAIVVSGFSGTCQPGGGGPCDHAASRELAAGQVGQMLQVQRGQATPQLMTAGSTTAPDAVAPPRSDEPLSKNSGSASGQTLSADPNLDPLKGSGLLSDAQHRTEPLVPTTPVVVAPADPVTISTPALPPPDNGLVWGRWTKVLGQKPDIDLAALGNAGKEVVALNSYYAIFRNRGVDLQLPQQGTIGFSLASSDAFVLNTITSTQSAATLQNGQLQVDFSKSTFNTSFDLLTNNDLFKLQAQGSVGSDGTLSGNSQFQAPTNMAVSGSLSSAKGAAYIFSTRLDDKRQAFGVTNWTAK
jgi:hypothetical protein